MWPASRRRARRPPAVPRRPPAVARRPPAVLPPLEAIALGLVHGPAELAPVSSSAHMAIIPWLLGWRSAELEGSVRKAFEVGLHAGAAVALAAELPGAAAPPGGLLLLAAACAPATLAGYALEGWVERRLAGPEAIAAGLTTGSLLMAVADRAPERRAIGAARAADGLWLGVAQALALAPGISRRAATESAARLRGFRRADAAALSRLVGPPVIAGAAVLKALRLGREGLGPGLRAGFAAGAGCSFASTLAAARVERRLRGGPLWPWAVYRLALAGAIVARLRAGSTARRQPPVPP